MRRLGEILEVNFADDVLSWVLQPDAGRGPHTAGIQARSFRLANQRAKSRRE
jgi:hypothetical protein